MLVSVLELALESACRLHRLWWLLLLCMLLLRLLARIGWVRDGMAGAIMRAIGAGIRWRVDMCAGMSVDMLAGIGGSAPVQSGFSG